MKRSLVKIILVICAILLFGSFYFKFSPFITYDSTWYHSYVSIISGAKSYAEWEIIRGFGFPFILYLAKTLFGNSIEGLNTMFFLFELGLIFFSYKIMKLVIRKDMLPWKKAIIGLAFIILFVFNPLIFGYSHTMLTESVIPFFAALSVFLALKLFDLDYHNKLYYPYIFVYGLISTYAWFIKQPYFIIAFMPLLFVFFVKLVRKFSIKLLTSYVLSVLFIMIMVFGTLNVWYSFIDSKKKETESSTEMSGQMSSGFMNGIAYHYRKTDICYKKDEIKKSKLSNKEKNQLLDIYNEYGGDACLHYKIYDVYNIYNTKVIDQQVFLIPNDEQVLSDSLKFILENVVSHPVLIMDSYVSYYLTMIDFFELDPYNYQAIRHFGYNIAENETIGFAIYKDWKNYWWTGYTKEQIKELENMNKATKDLKNMKIYESYNESSNVPKIWSLNFKKYQHIFTYGFLATPFLFLYYLGSVIRRRKEDSLKSKKNILLFVLFGTILFHLLTHVVVGALIDRYAYAAYPLLIVSLIIMFIPTKTKKEETLDLAKIDIKKSINLFVFNRKDKFDLKLIEKIKEDVLIVTNDSTLKISKKNIEVVYAKKYSRTSKLISLGLDHISNEGYDFMVLSINNSLIDNKKITSLTKRMKEEKINIITYSSGKKNVFIRGLDLINSLYIEFITAKRFNNITSNIILIDKHALKRMLRRRYFSKLTFTRRMISEKMIIEESKNER